MPLMLACALKVNGFALGALVGAVLAGGAAAAAMAVQAAGGVGALRGMK